MAGLKTVEASATAATSTSAGLERLWAIDLAVTGR